MYLKPTVDYQPISILKKLVNKNFKFLKVGPELTFNYSRLFFMQKIEDKVLFKDRSNLKENILVTMKNNKKYWIGYYSRRKKELFLNSKLDRMRYYFNTKKVENSIKVLKKNINKIDFKKISSYLNKEQRKVFLYYNKKKLSHFDNIKMIFISESLKRYFLACGHKVN